MKAAAGTDAQALAEGVRRRDPRAIARAISRIENHEPGAEELVRELFPGTGRALLVGLTGAPGTGHSGRARVPTSGWYKYAGRPRGVQALPVM